MEMCDEDGIKFWRRNTVCIGFDVLGNSSLFAQSSGPEF